LVIVLLLAIGAAVAGSIGACSYKSQVWNVAFDTVQVGDTEAAVIARFGTQPSVRELPGKLFSRYATQPRSSECAQRLWFENRLSLDTEAWSVELDNAQRVTKKSHWISP